METIQFKTNIKCGGCVAKVTPFLDAAAGKDGWKVDTVHPDKILSVKADISPADVVWQVEAAGFKASKM